MLLRTDGGVRVLRAKRVGMKRLLSTAVLLMIVVAFSSVASILPAYADEQRPSAAAVDSGSASAASDLVNTAQSKTADASTATSESAPDASAAASGQEKNSQHDDSSEEGGTARPDGPSQQEVESESSSVSEDTSSSKAVAANDVKRAEADSEKTQGTSPVFRLYNSLTSEHLYTTSKYEYDALPGMTHGDWVQEGIAWIAPDEGNPVYRLYNSGLGDHHYTVSVSERNTLIAYHGWLDEGIAFYSAREPDGYAVYRVYNGGLKRGQHHYTLNSSERDALVQYYDWVNEGVGWYAVGGALDVEAADLGFGDGWVTTSLFGHGNQLYWVRGGKVVSSELISASEAGYWAYATDAGYVVRGKWADPSTGYVYLANQKTGELESGDANHWLVSSEYGDGLQRYYLDPTAHAAIPGYSKEGWEHFTLERAGYVARNATVTVGGKSFRADNNGRLSEITRMDGIDIASYQKGINIPALTTTGFVIVKVSEGNYYTNPYWKQWASEVLSCGKKLGLYHYAGGRSSAETQAQFFLDRVADYLGKAVLVLDWEGIGNPQFDPGSDTEFVEKWTQYVKEKTGVTPWVYASASVAANYSGIGCPLWIAKYANKYYSQDGAIMTDYVDEPAFEEEVRGLGNVVCYQYTSCGGVDGYGEALDIDKFYGAPDDWDRYARVEGV